MPELHGRVGRHIPIVWYVTLHNLNGRYLPVPWARRGHAVVLTAWAVLVLTLIGEQFWSY